jgi:hypothetical protein
LGILKKSAEDIIWSHARETDKGMGKIRKVGASLFVLFT